MAIRVKRTDKLLFTEGITAHFIASLELFEGGDVDFLLAGVITFCRLNPCITLPYSMTEWDQLSPFELSVLVVV